jgi:type I restriction enzyme S subunit
MNLWTETTLKKVSKKVDYGYTASATEMNTGIKFLRITDIVPSSIDWETVPFCEISEAEFEKCRLAEGDVVIARTGATVGYAKQIRGNPPPAVFASYLVRMIPKENVSARFIGILVESNNYKYYINTIAGGSAQPNANAKDLSSFPFYLPPVLIQRKIAAIISAYDDLIENNKGRIASLEKMAKEIYREWFVRRRFPGHEKARLVKGAPSRWEVRNLGSFASEIKKGVNKSDLADDERYIGLEHIPRRSIAIKEWATADSVDSNKLLFQEQDILFGKIRPYLHKVALAHFSGACSSDTIVLRPKEKVYEGYLLFTVSSDSFIELATIACKGTKMPRADWGFLKKLELVVPDEKLLEAYQAQFDTLFSQIVNLLRANEALVSSRDRLLPRLISDKLSVENLDIQFPPGMVEELKAEPPKATHA